MASHERTIIQFKRFPPMLVRHLLTWRIRFSICCPPVPSAHALAKDHPTAKHTVATGGFTFTAPDLRGNEGVRDISVDCSLALDSFVHGETRPE